MTSKLGLVSLAVFALASGARANGVRVVDGSNGPSYATIQAAVDAAVDGSTLLVASGAYAPFIVDGKGVTIVASPGASVSVTGTLVVRNVPAARAVTIAGLAVTGAATAGASQPALRVESCAGFVRFQSCTLSGGLGVHTPQSGDCGLWGDGGSGALIAGSLNVSFASCSLLGGSGAGTQNLGYYECTGGDGGNGAESFASTIVFYDCIVRGGAGGANGQQGGTGGAGLRERSFGFFASGTQFRGGNGGLAWDFIAAWGGDGGHGVFYDAGTGARFVDCTRTGGSAGGNVVFPDYPGNPGSASFGPGIEIFLPGTRRTLAGPSLVIDDGTLALTLAGEPGDVVYLASSRRAAHDVPVGFFGVWLVPYPSPMSTTPLGTISASGVLNVIVPVNGLAFGVPAALLRLQGFAITASGERRLASPLDLLVVNRATTPDCDANGVHDLVQTIEGIDCNRNLVPDTCEIGTGAEDDCNVNSVPDACELASGAATDCNGNGILDACDAPIDCNANGVPDPCDVQSGTSPDLNENGIPDECDPVGFTRWVDASAAPGGDGSPANPFRTIQEGVEASLSGDTVIVRDGVYAGAGNKNVSIGSREIVLRSENGVANCVIDMQGNGRGLNVSGGGTLTGLRIEGFTFFQGSVPTMRGAGINLVGASPTIAACLFESNFATYGGAAINCEQSSARIERCAFFANRGGTGAVGSNGGAVFVSGSASNQVRIEGCFFDRNTSNYGGAVATLGPGSCVVQGSWFVDNEAWIHGGALFSAMYAPLSAPTERLFVHGCVFAGNRSPRGGAVFTDSSSPYFAPLSLLDCTLVDNTATQTGGALFARGQARPVVRNSIFWTNSAPTGAQIALESSGAFLDLAWTDLQGGTAAIALISGASATYGAGIQAADPLFADPDGLDGITATTFDNDYRLSLASPCVDAGENASVALDLADADLDGNTSEPLPFDLDGAARFVDVPSAPDTGAGTPPLVDLGPFELAP